MRLRSDWRDLQGIRNISKFSRASYKADVERGRHAEIEVANLLSTHLSEIPWATGFENLVDTKEDIYGHTDFFIETADVGKLRLQVKSSPRGAELFKEEFPHWVGGVYVVGRHEAEDIAWQRLKAVIIQARQQVLRIRGQPLEPVET